VTHSPSHLAWYEGRRPLGAVLHSSNEPGALLQWLCHDDSSINIDICNIIVIIMLHVFYVCSAAVFHDGSCNHSPQDVRQCTQLAGDYIMTTAPAK